MSVPFLPLDLHSSTCWIQPFGTWNSPCPDLNYHLPPHQCLLFSHQSQVLLSMQGRNPEATCDSSFSLLHFLHCSQFLSPQVPDSITAPTYLLTTSPFPLQTILCPTIKRIILKHKCQDISLIILHQHLAALVLLSWLYYGLYHSACNAPCPFCMQCPLPLPKEVFALWTSESPQVLRYTKILPHGSINLFSSA